VATLNVIRRWALRDQMSIREISRRTGLARNTVKRYLRSDETEPSYERRGSSSKLDPYAEKLATWLVIEATKSRKQRRTLRQIHTDSTQKGENQELIHIVSTFCSQRVWVNIRWKTRVKLQRNSTNNVDAAAASIKIAGLRHEATLRRRVTLALAGCFGNPSQINRLGQVWCGWRGSNPRPLASEANTLSTELQPQR
jgi:transcriptional regulator with XRE-family HTH domain